MLCGKLHYQKGFNLILVSYKSTWSQCASRIDMPMSPFSLLSKKCSRESFYQSHVSPGIQRVRRQLPSRNVERFQGGLVSKAHRLLYHSTLGSRVKKKKKHTKATWSHCASRIDIFLSLVRRLFSSITGHVARVLGR